MPQNWILLGASRGLGKSFAEALVHGSPQVQVEIASRKSAWSMDFADKAHWASYAQTISKKQPTHILYFAGGGPFGNFADKQWKDHEWAFKVNFEFPAFLIHNFAKEKACLEQVCIVGSSVAESSPDPGASSYSAAKHAMLGLVQSLHLEKNLPFDLRLFSPGYMDTDLLPAHAWPRQKSDLVQSKNVVAEKLLAWLQDVSKCNTHLVIRSHY